MNFQNKGKWPGTLGQIHIQNLSLSGPIGYIGEIRLALCQPTIAEIPANPRRPQNQRAQNPAPGYANALRRHLLTPSYSWKSPAWHRYAARHG